MSNAYEVFQYMCNGFESFVRSFNSNYWRRLFLFIHIIGEDSFISFALLEKTLLFTYIYGEDSFIHLQLLENIF